MYIVGQERRLVDPPSQVVAGVRTVTTNMDGRDALPRMSRPFAFKSSTVSSKPHAAARNFNRSKRSQKRNQRRPRHQDGFRSTTLAGAREVSATRRNNLKQTSFRALRP